MHTTPVSLLQRLRQPAAEAAWSRFVELYTPLLYFWGRRVGLQEQDAADLVQDVLTVLIRKLPDFEYDRHKSFRNWLRTVTLNKWRENRRRSAKMPSQANEPLEEIPAPDDGGLFEETEYRRQLVKRALATMQPEFSVITWKSFTQHVVDGQPATAVAAELHIRVGTVYAAKSRVLSRLRHELAGLLD